MKLYLATVCITPIATAILMVSSFIGVDHVPDWYLAVFSGFAIYYWIGIIVMIYDLWMQKITRKKKIMWTAINLFWGMFTLPIYWYFRVFRFPDKKETGQQI